jgi:hypothetical protein
VGRSLSPASCWCRMRHERLTELESYSRAQWTELQLQFRPPRDGPAPACVTMPAPRRSTSSSLRSSSSGATSACGRAAPIEQPQAACPPRRRMLPWPHRRGPAPNWLDPRVPAQGHRPPRLPRPCRLAAGGSHKGSTPAVLPGTSSRGRPRSKIYVKRGPRLQSMMLLGRVTCAGWRCVTFDDTANGCFRTKSGCRRRNSDAARPRCTEARPCQTRSRGDAGACGEHNQVSRVILALSRRKQGFDSPRERERNQGLIARPPVGVQQLSNKRLRTRMDFDGRKSCHARAVPPA